MRHSANTGISTDGKVAHVGTIHRTQLRQIYMHWNINENCRVQRHFNHLKNALTSHQWCMRNSHKSHERLFFSFYWQFLCFPHIFCCSRHTYARGRIVINFDAETGSVAQCSIPFDEMTKLEIDVLIAVGYELWTAALYTYITHTT